MDENSGDPQWDDWDDLDKLLYRDYANKQEVHRLSSNFQIAAVIEAEERFPDLDLNVLPQNVLDDSDTIPKGKKKKRGLKRKARRARDDEEDDDFDDYHYSAYKYQLFYNQIEEEKESCTYESYLKRHLENNNNPTASSSVEETGNDDLPRCSLLSTGKQKMFLRLRHKFAKGDFPLDEKFELFKALKKAVQKEQRDYISFCLRQAKYTKPIDYEFVLPGLVNYIERALFLRQHSIPKDYEALYHLHSVINVHKSTRTEVNFRAITLIEALGQVPYTDTKSEFYKGIKLDDVAKDLEYLIPSDNSLGHFAKIPGQKGPFIYKTPVSSDPNALHFAKNNEADIVTSSSVMQLLMDAHPYSLQNSATRRDIPVLVKLLDMPDGSQKKVVFMDKMLPPLEMTLYDKKVWACKKAVRAMFSASDIKTFDFTEMEDVEANKENETPEMYLPPKDIEGVRSTTANWTVDAIEEEEEDFPVAPPPNHNVTYGLYSLGKNDGGRKINLVVRSSYHAYERKSDGERPNYLHFSVKLEHQPEYGAQCTTISEISREWMALSLRKGATLCRVRVDAKTLEVIQVERKTIKSLNQECKLRGMNTNARIASLHHVFSELSGLEAGSYILQLIPIEGVARLLEHDTTNTTLRGGSYFNLHLHFRKSNHLIGPMSHVPYSFIDPSVATPYQKKNLRIPATFKPRNYDQAVTAVIPETPMPIDLGKQDVPMLFESPVKNFELSGQNLEFDEDEENISLLVSDNESFDDWLVENEIKTCAKDLELELEQFAADESKLLAEKIDSKDQEKKNEEKKDVEKKEPEMDLDLMRVMLDVQVKSPISMMEQSIMDGGPSVVNAGADG